MSQSKSRTIIKPAKMTPAPKSDRGFRAAHTSPSKEPPSNPTDLHDSTSPFTLIHVTHTLYPNEQWMSDFTPHPAFAKVDSPEKALLAMLQLSQELNTEGMTLHITQNVQIANVVAIVYARVTHIPDQNDSPLCTSNPNYFFPSEVPNSQVTLTLIVRRD